ncbi:MAG: PAS domain S-box protein [Marinicaulis sp.]|nr:PAS domain S-box protein [Marinicaulis sp.]
MDKDERRSLGDRFVDEILDTVETPIALLDGDGSILRFNHACETLTDYNENDVVGKKVWDFLIIDDEIEAVRQVFSKTQTENVPTHFTNYWKTKGGKHRLIQWSNKTVRMPKSSTVGVLATGVDITHLKSVEHSLKESQEYWRSTINASPISIITINDSGLILTFSKAAEETFGYSEKELVGQNINVLMPEPHHTRHDDYIRHYLETGEKRIIGKARRVKAKRRDGSTFPAMLHVSEFSDGIRIFVGFIEDLSEKEEIEQRLDETNFQLRHADRVGSMGEIATSIAHELNQPLTAAASLIGAVSIRLKKGECPECSQSIPLLNDAVSEIRRASEIIQQMREFVRKQKTAKSLYDINKVVEDAGALAIIGADADGIEVKWEMTPEAGEVELDRIQIQQVVTNLIRNAIDAMQGAPNRVLKISTARDNEYITVSISDTGPGLENAVKNKLFEPFVSSKENGMGVGLSISKSIIDAHQGEIIATNQKSGGCVFTFKLPAGANDRLVNHE